MTIFIKSYPKDFRFLKYCLMSIQKFVTGYEEIVLLLPSDCSIPIWFADFTDLKISIHTIKESGNGYMFQQLCKLNAWKYTRDEKIMFVDSDYLFDKQVDVSKIETTILYTHYNNAGDAICWKLPTEKAMAINVEYEFMQRMPLVYWRKTLTSLANYLVKIHNVSVDYYVMNQTSFSEFNLIGAYAWNFEKENYEWLEKEGSFIKTKNDIDVVSARWGLPFDLGIQFWSHAKKDGDKYQQYEFTRAIENINRVLNLQISDI